MVVRVGGRGKVEIEVACFGRVEQGAEVVFLGHDRSSHQWLLWWGEQDGIGGVWYGTASEAWAEFCGVLA